MELPEPIKQHAGTVRIVSTLVLAVIAIRSFVHGKRLRGLAAAGGAVAVGASTSTLDPTELEIEQVGESTTETGGLECAVCGESIAPGEPRRPNEVDETVHEACLE